MKETTDSKEPHHVVSRIVSLAIRCSLHTEERKNSVLHDLFLPEKRNVKLNVSIYSRDAVKNLIDNDFPANTAVISFYDPKDSKGYGNCIPVDYHKQCERIFYVCIHDIDIEILEDYGLTFDTYFPEADELSGFILQAKQDGLNILCQCEYGQSRSAACAAAIREYFTHDGINIFADYRYYPNQLVFNKILSSLKKVKKIPKKH